MGLPIEVNNLMLGSLGGYTVGRSLRFRSSASAYLSRTPASTTNQKTFTISTWLKLGFIATANCSIYTALQGNTTGNRRFDFRVNSDGTLYVNIADMQVSGISNVYTVGVLRDPSAWYHVVLAFDNTQATGANGIKFYINGVQQTVTVSNYTQNSTTPVNTSGNVQYIGRYYDSGTGALYADFYLAEYNFIDGQALTPSSFGAYDTNGVWQPKKYTGTYGTNGFYLPFSNTTSTTTLVQDSSGNGNNWTPNNISLTAGTTYDSMIDSPTVSASSSNYAVLNPTQPSGGTYQAGNQQFLANTAGQWKTAVGTMFAASGKYYWEVTAVALPTAGYVWAGAASSAINLASSTYNGASALPIGGDTNGWGVGVSGGNIIKYYNGSQTTFTAGTDSVGDVWMVAVDVDSAKIWFGRNGTWFGSGDPAAGTNAAFTNLSGSIGPACSAYLNTGATAGLNCGQRPFTYTPPTGFKALNTYNLPAPSIANGAQYMAATTYTGTGATQSISNGSNNTIGTTFRPDLIWGKQRNGASSNVLTDSVRGTNSQLSSNLTNAQDTQTDVVTAFNSNGFTVGASAGFNMNQSGSTLVAWQWKAGGTGVTNNSGSITSTVSANTTAGFSVVTWTGTFAAATVGHGLGVAPSMIIVKTRTQAAVDWAVYHTSIGATNGLYLNATNAQFATSTWWNNTSPTSSVFSVAGAAQTNGNAQNMVAYCFAAVRNYSAFGSYNGTGSSDGAFVFTGFSPRFVLIKKSSGINSWVIYDTSRQTYNANSARIYPNLSNAEQTGTSPIDILSNGFKCRDTDDQQNASGGTYIYAAFAENPFNISRAR